MIDENRFKEESQKIDDLFEEYEAAQKKAQEAMQERLCDVFKAVFEQYPEIKKFGWSQYTPYFNDGEPCEFSVNSPMFEFVADEHLPDTKDSVFEDDMWNFECWRHDPERCTLETYEVTQKIERILDRSEAFLLNIFGDHTQVVVTPNGLKSFEYDHD
jgi:hypothetical protein